MHTVNIKMNTADEAIRLVRILNKFPMDIDTRREHIVLDAKSLVSMLALVHTPGLKLDIHGEKAGNVVNILKQEGFCEVH